MNLKCYSAMAASLLAATAASQAQVEYTDIEPDFILSGWPDLPLDLNNDGVFDVTFTLDSDSDWDMCTFKSTSYWMEAIPNPNLSFIGAGYAFALSMGEEIGSIQPFTSNPVLRHYFWSYHCSSCNDMSCDFTTSEIGYWNYNIHDRYLGFQLIESSDTLYGWIRLANVSYYEMAVKDYAINTAGESIEAGAINCSELFGSLLQSPVYSCGAPSLILAAANVPGVNYTWYMNGDSTGIGYSQVATESGDYYVTGETNYCLDTSQIVHVEFTSAAPVPVITQLNDTLQSTDATTYQWLKNGTILNGATNQKFVPMVEPENYTVQITDQYGCSNISDNFFFVSCTPVPKDLINVGDSALICYQESLQLKLNDQSGIIYNWYRDNILVLSGYSQEIYTTSLPGEYYCLIDKSGKICPSDTVVVDTSNLHPTIINVNDTLHSTEAPQYLWYKNGYGISGATNESYVVTANGVYFVQGTYDNGCEALSNWIAIFQCQFDDPLQNDDFVACSGDTVNLWVLYQQTVYIGGCQWYLDGIPIPGAENNTFKTTVSGEYYCLYPLNVTTCYSDPVSIEFIELPTITQSGDTLLSSYLPNYQWLYNGLVIPDAHDQIYVPTQSGNYTVQSEGTNGCTESSEPFFYSTVQSPVTNELPEIATLPDKILQVHFNDNLYSGGLIEVVNSVGQVVSSSEVNASTLHLQLSNLSSQWYCVKIMKGEHIFTKAIFLF